MTKQTKSAIKEFCSDRDGKLVLAQKPNLPILGWAVFKLASMTTSSQPAKTGLESIATGFLFVWAYLEITEGDSNFRKLLGLIVLGFMLVGFFS